MESDCRVTRREQVRPHGVLLLHRLVAVIADLAGLRGFDAARVVAFFAPLRRLVAAATILIFRGDFRWGGRRSVGGEKKDGRSKQESKVSHAYSSCGSAAADKRKQKGPDKCPAL